MQPVQATSDPEAGSQQQQQIIGSSLPSPDLIPFISSGGSACGGGGSSPVPSGVIMSSANTSPTSSSGYLHHHHHTAGGGGDSSVSTSQQMMHCPTEGPVISMTGVPDPMSASAMITTAPAVPRVVSTLSSSQSSGSLTLQPSSAASKAAAKAAATTTSTTSGGKTKVAAKKKTNAKKKNSGGAAGAAEEKDGAAGGGPKTDRRQKRLERNRESARLSRRRRKQYLEVLEERVTQLSADMDQGRRSHVTQAVPSIDYRRRDLLEPHQGMLSLQSLPALETTLARTSQELMLATTFQAQQLKSFCLPPSTKFIMWLTLQNDAYFRGGRAASERLSAARIGERMLISGTRNVTPAQSMWPLLCNEVALSYEQEEKVRTYQRSLLQKEESWLDRHSAFATAKVMQSSHDATQALTLRLGQRERTNSGLLTQEQRIKFLSWASKNRERVTSTTRAKVGVRPLKDQYETSPGQHLAANLYVLNHRLQMILKKVPPAAPLVTGTTLHRLSRRPSFESLGATMEKDGKEEGRLTRDMSFASSGSLKRDMSEMTMEGVEDTERPAPPAFSPQDAETAAAPLVEKTLGFVKPIIPPQPRPSVVMPNQQPQQQVVAAAAAPAAPSPSPASWTGSVPQRVQSMPGPFVSEPAPGHVRKSSFFPSHLNVVPEEMWPSDAAADDILLGLMEEDWAIGEGIDMDMTA